MTIPISLAFSTLILLLSALYVVVVRPRISQWGATDQEHQATWPGDNLVTRPSHVWTNAITTQAPAAQVWPWLVQLGQGRGGLYSHDWLENLTRCAAGATGSSPTRGRQSTAPEAPFRPLWAHRVQDAECGDQGIGMIPCP
jgi:hypothetical protein